MLGTVVQAELHKLLLKKLFQVLEAFKLSNSKSKAIAFGEFYIPVPVLAIIFNFCISELLCSRGFTLNLFGLLGMSFCLC